VHDRRPLRGAARALEEVRQAEAPSRPLPHSRSPGRPAQRSRSGTSPRPWSTTLSRRRRRRRTSDSPGRDRHGRDDRPVPRAHTRSCLHDCRGRGLHADRRAGRVQV